MYWRRAGSTAFVPEPVITGGRLPRDIKPLLTTLTVIVLKKIHPHRWDIPDANSRRELYGVRGLM
jgi:hypothetical protein